MKKVWRTLFDWRVLKKTFGISLFLEIFYLMGYYLFAWPLPSVVNILQIIFVVFAGVIVGVIFSMVWPISSQVGLERVIRTVLIVAPSLGLGIGLQLLFQGKEPTQALYFIFALSSWLGSGHFVQKEELFLSRDEG